MNSVSKKKGLCICLLWWKRRSRLADADLAAPLQAEAGKQVKRTRRSKPLKLNVVQRRKLKEYLSNPKYVDSDCDYMRRYNFRNQVLASFERQPSKHNPDGALLPCRRHEFPESLLPVYKWPTFNSLAMTTTAQLHAQGPRDDFIVSRGAFRSSSGAPSCGLRPSFVS